MIPKVAVCTIIAKNYLAQARVLMASVRLWNPELLRIVILVDRIEGCFDPATEPFEIISSEDLNIPKSKWFHFKYTVLELSTAVKPYVLEFLFHRYNLDKIIYLDPDIKVYSSLQPLLDKLDVSPAVITPPAQSAPYFAQQERLRDFEKQAATIVQAQQDRLLLLREGHSFHGDVLTSCTRARAEFHATFESDSLATIFSLVAAGLGISIVPAMSAPHSSGCLLLPLAEPKVRRVGYARLRSSAGFRPLRAFTDWLRKSLCSVETNLDRSGVQRHRFELDPNDLLQTNGPERLSWSANSSVYKLRANDQTASANHAARSSARPHTTLHSQLADCSE